MCTFYGSENDDDALILHSKSQMLSHMIIIFLASTMAGYVTLICIEMIEAFITLTKN